MKKQVSLVLAVMVLAAFLCSCVTTMTDREGGGERVVGTVTDTMTTFQFFHIPNKNRVKAKAYSTLMNVARQQYQGNFDIRNIRISSGKLSGLQAIFIAGGGGSGLATAVLNLIAGAADPGVPIGIGIAVGTNLIGNFQKITVTGEVVGDATPIGPSTGTGVYDAPPQGGSSGGAPAPGANF